MEILCSESIVKKINSAPKLLLRRQQRKLRVFVCTYRQLLINKNYFQKRFSQTAAINGKIYELLLSKAYKVLNKVTWKTDVN